MDIKKKINKTNGHCFYTLMNQALYIKPWLKERKDKKH